MFEEVLQNQVALVTGASRGLGRVIAQTLANAGATIVVHYNQSDQEARMFAEELEIQGAQADTVGADMTDEFEVIAMVESILGKHERIDILVNNVGPFADIPLHALPEGDWEWIMNGNLKSAYLGCRHVGNAMLAHEGGVIVNIAAASAFNPDLSVYSLAKRAVMHLTEIMAVELAPNVRVNAIAPGLLAGEHLSKDVAKDAVEATPLKRLVSPEEVARLALLLCTDLFRSVTGQTILMDGGRSLLRR